MSSTSIYCHQHWTPRQNERSRKPMTKGWGGGVPTAVTCRIVSLLQATLPSLAPFPSPLPELPWTASGINDLHSDPDLL